MHRATDRRTGPNRFMSFRGNDPTIGNVLLLRDDEMHTCETHRNDVRWIEIEIRRRYTISPDT